ncbi:hypothetical protein [Nostoc sp.]|uniref:hypothetical protein n=1 Tax=Nostoc sp. TaxID=1180 RepID=UPI002FF523F9
MGRELGGSKKNQDKSWYVDILDDLFHKFMMCPNGITSENFKQALTEYENEFIKNPNIIDPFDI